jgi:biopolymer transport protein ExbD
MADTLVTGNENRRRAGFYQIKKLKIRVDMTPMVDLGLLLITFFVFTATLSKPSVVKLNMPKKEGPPATLGDSYALTVLLDDHDRIYYYNGNWKDALATGQVFKTNYSESNGLGNVIREKEKLLVAGKAKEGRDGLMLLIKAGKGASYQNVIDALDEAMINVVKKYTILSTEKEETEWMEKQKQ